MMLPHEPADVCKFGELCKNTDLCCDFKAETYSDGAHIEFTLEEDGENDDETPG